LAKTAGSQAQFEEWVTAGVIKADEETGIGEEEFNKYSQYWKIQTEKVKEYIDE